MAASIQAPQQYKQSSRKGKKAWRKNVDVSQVQEGLQNLRDEEIKGGVVSEKPSTDLFTVDPTGSTEIQKLYHKHHKPLKADEILAQRSAIPTVSSRKRGNENVTDGIIEPKTKRRKESWVSHKELQRLKDIAYSTKPVLTDPSQDDHTVDHDPWAISEDVTSPIDQTLNFLDKTKPKVAPKSIRHAPISMTASGKPVRAIPNPKAGTSYNPVFSDWDSLLLHEGEKEVAAERQRLVEEQAEHTRLARIAAAEAEELDKAVTNDDDSAWEGIESEHEGGEFHLSRKRPERKTPAQRNRILRRKEVERKEKHERQMKKRRAQQEQIRAIARAVEESEKARAAVISNKLDSSSESDDETLRRRRLGKIPISEKPLEVVLPDELRESLRLLKPEGNILNDRFRNLLVQGKIESRRRIIQPKKAKRTVTEKWTYKDWKLK